jgi:hypothetical protein
LRNPRDNGSGGVTSLNRGSLGRRQTITRSGRDRSKVRTPTSTLGVRG